MNPNNSKKAVEDNLVKDESLIISFDGMNLKQIVEEMQKMKAEIEQNKEASSNQIGELKNVMDGWKSANRVIRVCEELKEGTTKVLKAIEGLKMADEKEISVFEELKEGYGKFAKENEDLKRKVEKLTEENGELKEENRRINITEVQKNVVLESLKEEMSKMMVAFAEINAKLEEGAKLAEKMRELEDRQKIDNEKFANLTARIDGMECIQSKNNKWNAADCGLKLTISGEGLVVMHSAKTNGYNCVRAALPVPSFHLNANRPTIASYFEAQIVSEGENPTPTGFLYIGIGFCTQQNSLERGFVRTKDSFGICRKSGMHINTQFNKFGNDPVEHEHFKAGDLIGVGIIHFPANSSNKCFATLNGRLLGIFDLPAKCADLQLFPAASLFNAGESIRANFGREEWQFNPSRLLNQM